MKSLLKPFWIILSNTLPFSVLLFLLFIEWQTIHTLLREGTQNYWFIVAGIVLGLLIIQSIYAIRLIILRKTIPLVYGVITLIVHLLCLIFYVTYSDEIVPREVPAWMIDGNKYVYVFTFMMPSLLYAMIVLILETTPDVTKVSFAKNLALSLAIPFGFYFFFFMIGSVYHPSHITDYVEVFIWILIVGVMVSFFYFATRALYILIFDKNLFKKIPAIWWKIIIALIFPVLGLSLYATLMPLGGFFGDFSNKWFFILAISNGIIVCVPRSLNPKINLLLWILRAITFSFTCYFFLVFLPYTPLSFILLFTVVFGLLMLTPSALFIIHSAELYQDFQGLKQSFNAYYLIISGLLSFMLIPTVIIIDFWNARNDLHITLEYVYSPNYEKEPQTTSVNLKKLLKYVKATKQSRPATFSWTPYIDTFYSWMVLDNLSLSNRKISDLEQIYLGKASQILVETTPNQIASLQDIRTESVYDSTTQTWKSWVHLAIRNGKNQNAEYHGKFNLPVGTFVTHYYLDIAGKREMGILAEKKTVKWVYRNIVNESIVKDPGLLYFSDENKVELNVYPFAPNELRTTGFQLIHREPIELSIGNKIAKLGADKHPNVILETPHFIFIPNKEKAKLSESYRKPYFHFILDVAHGNSFQRYTYQLQKLKKEYPAYFSKAKISLVNSYVKTVDYTNNWMDELSEDGIEGGFFLERGIQQIAYQETKNQSSFYPIIVVLSDSIANGVFPENKLSHWCFAFPEGANFLLLDKQNILTNHTLGNPIIGELAKLDSILYPKKVRLFVSEGRKYFLADDDKTTVIFKSNALEEPLTFSKESWQSGMLLESQRRQLLLHPEQQEKYWRTLVKNSFESNILSEYTSYIALENEAQKAVLKRKQHEVLNANSNLDLVQDLERMGEPELWLMIAIVGLLGVYHERKKIISRFFS